MQALEIKYLYLFYVLGWGYIKNVGIYMKKLQEESDLNENIYL